MLFRSIAGSLSITTGQDLTFGNWKAQDVRAVTVGLVDFNGHYSAGNLTAPTAITNPTGGAVRTLNLSAHENLTLSGALSVTSGLGLRAGKAILGMPSSISISSPGTGVQLSSGADLVISSPISVNGPVVLSSLGAPGPDGSRTGGTVRVTSNISAGSGTVTVASSTADSILSGTVLGGGFIKEGSGTLTVTGSLSSAGTVYVNAGTLLLNSSAKSMVVADGATLGGTATLNGSLTVQAGGEVSPGNSPGIVTVNGDVNFQSDSTSGPVTLVMELSGSVPGTDYDQIAVTGEIGRAHV